MNAKSFLTQHVTPTSAHADERALVLGGGGSTGHAWLIGVVAGLFDAGLDVTNADLMVGTSAGATAAAQLVGAERAGATASTLFAEILASRASTTDARHGC